MKVVPGLTVLGDHLAPAFAHHGPPIVRNLEPSRRISVVSQGLLALARSHWCAPHEPRRSASPLPCGARRATLATFSVAHAPVRRTPCGLPVIPWPSGHRQTTSVHDA